MQCSPEDKLPTPSWLEIHNLEDLKEKLIGVIVVLLAVTFLANVVEWDGSNSILALGVAIGLVLLALSLLLRGFGQHNRTEAGDNGDNKEKNPLLPFTDRI